MKVLAITLIAHAPDPVNERPFISSSPPVVLSHLAALPPGSGCSPR